MNGTTSTIANCLLTRGNFEKGVGLPPMDTNWPRPANKDWPVTAVRFDLGTLKTGEKKLEKLMIIYD